MMKSVPVLLAVVLTVLVPSSGNSGPLGMYGFLTMPVGDFGDDSGDYAGLANPGFGVGTELRFPLAPPGLSWIVSGSVLLNPLDTDAMEDVMGGGRAEAGWWVNVPLLTGIRYESGTAPGMKLYGMGLVGLNIVRPPELEWSGLIYDGYDWYDVEVKQESESATSFGLQLGGGILLGDRFDISLRYLNLGKPECDGTVRVTVDSYTESDRFEFEQPISMFLISAGMRF